MTQWAVRTGDPGAIYNLRILRPINNSSYTGVGTSPNVVVPALTTDSVLISNVSLPIKQGDAIGVAVGPAGSRRCPPGPTTSAETSSATLPHLRQRHRLQAPSPTFRATSC